MATNMIKRERVKRTHSSERLEMDQHASYNHSVHSQQHVSGFSSPEDLSDKKIRPSNDIMYEDSISTFHSNRFPNHHTPGKDKVCDIEKRVSKRLSSTEEDIAMRASPESDSVLDHSEDCLNPANSMHEFGLNGRPYLNETTQLETLENFAKDFKQKRIKLGYTQGDVGLAMGKFFKHDFSQTTISRFEALNLSFKNMCKLRPMLEKWLEYTHRLAELSKEGKEVNSLPYELQVEGDVSNGRKRKKRTSIDQKRRDLLDKIFIKNPKPTSDDLHSIAEECGLDKEVVRVWFCNRRQKEKRIQIHEQQSHEEDVTPPDSPRSNIFSMPPHQRDSSSRYESLPQRTDLIHPPLCVPGAVTMATSNSKIEDEIPAKRRSVTTLLDLQAGQSQDKQRVAKDEPFSPMGKYPNLMDPIGFSNSNPIHHTILRSAHAAQGSDYVTPAYSALGPDQYRKSVSSAKTTGLPMHIPHPNFYSTPSITNATSIAAAIGKTLSPPSVGSPSVLTGINRVMQPSVPTGSQQALNSLLHHASPTSLNHSFQINPGNATTT